MKPLNDNLAYTPEKYIGHYVNVGKRTCLKTHVLLFTNRHEMPSLLQSLSNSLPSSVLLSLPTQRQRKESQTCSLPKVYLVILVTPLSVTRPVSDTAPGQRLNTASLVSVSCVATTSQLRLLAKLWPYLT